MWMFLNEHIVSVGFNTRMFFKRFRKLSRHVLYSFQSNVLSYLGIARFVTFVKEIFVEFIGVFFLYY